ncbi:Ubiquitin-related modifier 1 family [Cryptosporidium sp. chipmunk genotype I]|uniref:Ubiquitin-related modifier 1 family n=1 Tax=Cryptosporidium sp. chipmunk genotype I TaxID=1280935 RepID=UPI00351A798A|nr:Ubiquitin-related modifier 1 family [Cryptosporidium sp. chipmunk genotype I]
MTIKVEFSGGLEILAGDKQSFEIELNDLKSNSMKSLILYVKENIIQYRKDHFIETGSKIKPGIIVLVNNCDWDILGGENYALSNGDLVTFIMTLHGG